MESTQLTRKSGIGGVLRSIGRGVDLARRLVVNLLFLFILFMLIALSGVDVAPPIEDSTALWIRPVGSIVEELAGDPLERAINKLTESEEPETLLRDVIDALDRAVEDERIDAVHLDLDQLGGTGLSKLQDIAAAIGRVRSAGKPVIASADIYSQSAYYLAAHSDEVYLNDMGMVGLHGFALYRQYHREGLDRLGVEWNVFKVGEFKSSPEAYTHREMSEEAKTANREWMGDLWRAYVEDIARARNLSAETIISNIDSADELLAATDGDAARLAKDLGLVDHVGPRHAIRDRLIELVGKEDDGESYRRVSLDNYVLAMTDRRGFDSSDAAVGVIVARGAILPGTQPPGAIGAESTSELIRQAREDSEIKALVLRVDSGGGSAFASEVIRRELDAFRDQGKPVVVSMGTVAASGGYWIGATADEIWASPTTITGSIGIYGMFPTFQVPLERYLGTSTSGVETNELATLYRPDLELSPRFGGMLENMINHGYELFLGHVSSGRELGRDEVDEIARGRVWSGEDAREHKLVDQLGSLSEAIASAGKLAELQDPPPFRYIETELEFSDRIALSLLSRVAAILPARTIPVRSRFASELASWIEDRIASISDPRGLYADCDCAVEW